MKFVGLKHLSARSIDLFSKMTRLLVFTIIFGSVIIVFSSSRFLNESFSNFISGWSQLGSDLNGTAAGDQFGISLSMNSSGNRIVVGASESNTNYNEAGQVKVFQWNGAEWNQLGLNINGKSEGDRTGVSVSMNSAGDRIAVGAPRSFLIDDPPGQARVYDWNGVAWTQLGGDFVGENTGDYNGVSVSLNCSGDRVAFGAPFNQPTGHVRLYSWNGQTWVQLGADIDGDANFMGVGFSVSLNCSGDRVAIGTFGANKVRVYSWNGMSWIQEGDDIVGQAAESTGWSVSFNSVGDYLAIGAPFDATNGENSGSVGIYKLDGGNWSLVGDVLNGLQGEAFGYSVSMNDIGNRVAIGATGMGAGKVRIYSLNGSSWSQLNEDILGESDGDLSGNAVSMNGSGDRVAIGAPLNSGIGSEAGHARIYQSDETCFDTLVLDAAFLANDPHASVFKAAKIITSDGVITSNEQIVFDAKNGVNLDPQFEVQAGALLEILLNGCMPDAILKRYYQLDQRRKTMENKYSSDQINLLMPRSEIK